MRILSRALTCTEDDQVVGLTCFDLRRLGKVDKLGMAGVSGSKFPAIREHLAKNIGEVYKDMDLSCVFDTA